MPMIHIEYNDAVVSDVEAEAVSNAVQAIVSQATDIKDVFVYANAARIKVQIAPLEIFVRMTNQKIVNRDKLIATIKDELSTWKSTSDFKHPINLTLIPMDWDMEIDI